MKPPTREEVKEWIETGDWGGEGMDVLIVNACRLAEAHLRALDVIDAAEALAIEHPANECTCTERLLDAVRGFREG